MRVGVGRDTIDHLQGLNEIGMKYTRIVPELVADLRRAHERRVATKEHVYRALRRSHLFTSPLIGTKVTMRDVERLGDRHGFTLLPRMLDHFDRLSASPLHAKRFTSVEDLSSAIDSETAHFYAYLIGPHCHILARTLQQSLTTHDAARLLAECSSIEVCRELIENIQEESIGYRYAALSLLIMELRKKQSQYNRQKETLLTLLRTAPPSPSSSPSGVFHPYTDEIREMQLKLTVNDMDDLIARSTAGIRTEGYVRDIMAMVGTSATDDDNNGDYRCPTLASLDDVVTAIRQLHFAFVSERTRQCREVQQFLQSDVIRANFIRFAGSNVGVGGSLIRHQLGRSDGDNVSSSTYLDPSNRCSLLDAAKLLESLPNHSMTSLLGHLTYLNGDTSRSFNFVVPDLCRAVAKMEIDAHPK